MKKDLMKYIETIKMNEKNIKRKNTASIFTIIVELLKVILTIIFIKKVSFLTSTIIFIFAIIASLTALYIFNNNEYKTIKKYNILDMSSLIFFISNIYGGILIESIFIKEEIKLFHKLKEKLKIKKLKNELYYDKKVYLYIFLSILICYEKLEINGLLFCILSYFVLFVFFIKDIKKSIKEFNKNKTAYIIHSILVYFVTLMISSLLFMLIFYIVGEDSTNQQLLNDEPLLWSLFTGIMYAPVVEELLFRGCLRKLLKNDIAFILISGISFGVWHVIGFEQSLIQYLYAIPYSVMGIGLSYIYSKTNNLTTTIGIHALNNILASL